MQKCSIYRDWLGPVRKDIDQYSELREFPKVPWAGLPSVIYLVTVAQRRDDVQKTTWRVCHDVCTLMAFDVWTEASGIRRGSGCFCCGARLQTSLLLSLSERDMFWYIEKGGERQRQ